MSSMLAIDHLEEFATSPSVHELSQLIDNYHSNMLEADTHEQKQENLRLLKGCITQYLYKVHHRTKFSLEQTEGVIAQSVNDIHDFDPREAMHAFEDLAKYAQNLLEQPWRKEFHKIKLTSGFFMHNIKAHLKNAQDMLIVLGYAGTDDYTLELHSIAGTDILKAFSRDCYVASQECLILSQTWEKLQPNLPQVYPNILKEIWDARCISRGNVDALFEALIVPVQKKLYEIEVMEKERQNQLELKALQEAMKKADLAPPPDNSSVVGKLIDLADDEIDYIPSTPTSSPFKSTTNKNSPNYNYNANANNIEEKEIVKKVLQYTNHADKKPKGGSSKAMQQPKQQLPQQHPQPSSSISTSTSTTNKYKYQHITPTRDSSTKANVSSSIVDDNSSVAYYSPEQSNDNYYNNVNGHAQDNKPEEISKDLNSLDDVAVFGDGRRAKELEHVAYEQFLQQQQRLLRHNTNMSENFPLKLSKVSVENEVVTNKPIKPIMKREPEESEFNPDNNDEMKPCPKCTGLNLVRSLKCDLCGFRFNISEEVMKPNNKSKMTEDNKNPEDELEATDNEIKQCTQCTGYNSIKNIKCDFCGFNFPINEPTKPKMIEDKKKSNAWEMKSCHQCTLLNPRRRKRCEACDAPL